MSYHTHTHTLTLTANTTPVSETTHIHAQPWDQRQTLRTHMHCVLGSSVLFINKTTDFNTHTHTHTEDKPHLAVISHIHLPPTPPTTKARTMRRTCQWALFLRLAFCG